MMVLAAWIVKNAEWLVRTKSSATRNWEEAYQKCIYVLLGAQDFASSSYNLA